MRRVLEHGPFVQELTRLRERLAGRIAGSHGNWSFAQEGEDRILARIYERRAAGFYVDVGAHHPRRFSNTYLLYRKGWRGIAIDAAPAAAEAFRRLRPRDTVVTMALGDQPGDRTYFEFDDPALNTLLQERARMLVETTDYRITHETRVPVDRLDNVLRRHVPNGTSINVMSVDVEGMDEEVLRSNDWSAYRPGIVIAEVTGLRTLVELLDSPLSAMMATYGYEPYAKTHNSVFFKDAD